MPKRAKALGPLEVSQKSEPGLYAVGGVAGLHLIVGGPKSKSWILRTMVGGKRRDIGLGSYPENGVARAREKALEAKDEIKKGQDPILAKKAARAAIRAERDRAITFGKAAEEYIAAHEAEWRNGKHADQWRNTIKTYAEPYIGNVLVRDVNTAHIVRILEQKEETDSPTLWVGKNETASRLRGRLECILDWGAVRGLRTGENPARWRGHLDHLLPNISRAKRIQHHAAIALDDAGAFMAELRKLEGTGARCLEFLALTACRSGEARGALWSEIDLELKVWSIPASRMKAGRPHRVPLNDAAINLLKALPRSEGVDLVFPNAAGMPLSDMAMTALMRRMDRRDAEGRVAVPHGLRSTFRDWAGERTGYPRDVVEQALAHGREDKTEAAYYRTDLFQKRIRLMADWGKFLDKVINKDNVFPIHRTA
ncbi:MAG TPA: tyrosine-type recombinase/integrase [Burkholderiaceae bacterium]|nr:tyrosine-type recombinase/integrase [Burkholderiaceae bacterium]